MANDDRIADVVGSCPVLQSRVRSLETQAIPRMLDLIQNLGNDIKELQRLNGVGVGFSLKAKRAMRPDDEAGLAALQSQAEGQGAVASLARAFEGGHRGPGASVALVKTDATQAMQSHTFTAHTAEWGSDVRACAGN